MKIYSLLNKLKNLVGLILILAVIGPCFFACVPNRRLVYLQHQGDIKTINPVDTVLRSYNLKRGPYTLKAEDIISLRVASVTETEFNFIRRYETELGIIRKLNQYKQGEQDILGRGGMGNQMMLGGGGMRGQSDDGGLSSIILDRMNSGFVLDLKGELELPEIGRLKLAGLTIPEAEALVKNALTGYYETPMVRIQLLNFHYTILGEVNQEGRYTSFDPELTIFDAIALAGNLSEFADRSNIKIVRREGGEAKIIYLNALDERMLNAENFYLKRDDLIIVPPLAARTASMYTLPRTSSLFGIVGGALSLIAIIISLTR